MINNL